MRYIFVILSIFVNLFGLDYVITNNELNKNVSNRFPIQKQILFSTFTFSNPNINIIQNEINFECDVSNKSIQLNGKELIFRVNSTSGITYRDGDIYLKDIEIQGIENQSISKALEDKIKLVASAFLNIYFSKKPIFSFKNNKYINELANTIISDIVIENNQVVVKI